MNEKIATIEGLAAFMLKPMASKEDLQGLATKRDIQQLRDETNERFERVDARFETIEGRLDHLDARVGRIEADIHELRGEIVYRHFEDALGRITYLEKKLDIESGV